MKSDGFLLVFLEKPSHFQHMVLINFVQCGMLIYRLRMQVQKLSSLLFESKSTRWLSARKKLKVGGGGAKDNRPLFFKTVGYCFYSSFYFGKPLGRKTAFGGRGSRLPPPPVAESPHGDKNRVCADASSQDTVKIFFSERSWYDPASRIHFTI